MSIETKAADIREEFSWLEDWEARYAHLIDLGKANPPLASASSVSFVKHLLKRKSRLFSASLAELSSHHGVGPTRWAQLQAALELARLQEIEASFTAYKKRLHRSRSPAAATIRT